MKDLQFFNFKDQPVRVVMIDGKPNWVLADVCKPLDLGDPSRVADRLDSGGTTFSRVIDSLGREQEMLCINEPNLYRLIFRSNKKQAKDFQNWVFEVVLPSIRQTGSYSMQQAKELDPIETAQNPQLLRQAVEQLEDIALAAAKKAQLFKLLEQHYYPAQYRTRGKRKLPQAKPVVVWNRMQLTQMTIIFEIA